jgi:hypothetical protein
MPEPAKQYLRQLAEACREPADSDDSGVHKTTLSLLRITPAKLEKLLSSVPDNQRAVCVRRGASMRFFHSGLLAGERVIWLSYSARLFLQWLGSAKPVAHLKQRAAK